MYRACRYTSTMNVSIKYFSVTKYFSNNFKYKVKCISRKKIDYLSNTYHDVSMTNLSGHEIRSPLLGRRKAVFFKAMFDALCFYFMPIIFVLSWTFECKINCMSRA